MLETNALLKNEKEFEPVYLSASTITSLRKEFGITADETAKSIEGIIQKAIGERIAENNSNVFTEAETKELEEELKGLGYI